MGERDAEGVGPERADDEATDRPVPTERTGLNGHGLNGHGLTGTGLNGHDRTGPAHALHEGTAPESTGVARGRTQDKAGTTDTADTTHVVDVRAIEHTSARADLVAASPASAPAATAAAARVRAARSLSISGTLAAWARGLYITGIALLVVAAGVLVAVIAILSPEAWPIDVMIALAGLPVALAIAWIVRRAAGPASEGFVGAVTRTPLVAIAPPPRPAGLGTPWAVVRAIGLLPAVIVLVALGMVVFAGDALALGRSDEALRVGAAAITCDVLIALAALVLALGGAVAQAGRAVGERERHLGARFYAVSLPDGQSGTATGICAVPEPL